MQAMTPQIDASSTSTRNNVRDPVIEHDEERERLLAEPPPRQELEDDAPSLDAFWSGTATVADFHILATLRKQWEDYGNASASALQPVGFSAEFAAVTANRRINAASQRFQRNIESLGA